MTPVHRKYLDEVACEYPHGPVAAALADLDACRAALAPVAERLGRHDWTGPMSAEESCWMLIRRAEAAVVLAAGE